MGWRNECAFLAKLSVAFSFASAIKCLLEKKWGKKEAKLNVVEDFLSLIVSCRSCVCWYRYRLTTARGRLPGITGGGMKRRHAGSMKQAHVPWHVFTLTGPCMVEAKVLRRQKRGGIESYLGESNLHPQPEGKSRRRRRRCLDDERFCEDACVTQSIAVLALMRTSSVRVVPVTLAPVFPFQSSQEKKKAKKINSSSAE